MIASATPDVNIDEAIAELMKLRVRQRALADLPISIDAIDQLTYLKADYIDLFGPKSHNAASITNRISHYRDELLAVEPFPYNLPTM